MNEQNNPSGSLWKSRAGLAKINIGMSLVLFLLAAGVSGLSAANGAAAMLMFFPAACTAFLAVCDRSPLWLFTFPASYGIAFLVCRDALTSLISLLYIPLCLALIFCIFTEKNLSVTTAVLTVAVGLTFALYALIGAYSDGVSIVAGVTDTLDALRTQMTDALSALRLPDADGEVYSLLSDTQIAAAVESAVMVAPSVVVMCCEIIAYFAAKSFRLLSLITSKEFMFRRGRWQMSASLPAGIIFILGYFITSFTEKASVAAYSAANLMYILLIPLAIAGGREMFGKESRFRTSMGTPGKIAVIVMCVISFYISPVLLPQLFAFWASADAVINAVKAFTAGRRGDNG